MKVLNIYDAQNTWTRRLGPWGTGWKGFFKADGDEFKRQEDNAAIWYKNNHCQERDARCLSVQIVGKNAKQKRWNLFDRLEELAGVGRKYDRINFFCHGGARNLNRGMIKQGVNIGKFCKRLKDIAADDCKIVLYSCKTGKLDDGFAAKVARLTGLEVIGHTTSGHTTKNPYKKMFDPSSEIAKLMDTFTSCELWKVLGGIRALKKRLWASDQAPFEFVEEVFDGE